MGTILQALQILLSAKWMERLQLCVAWMDRASFKLLHNLWAFSFFSSLVCFMYYFIAEMHGKRLWCFQVYRTLVSHFEENDKWPLDNVFKTLFGIHAASKTKTQKKRSICKSRLFKFRQKLKAHEKALLVNDLSLVVAPSFAACDMSPKFLLKYPHTSLFFWNVNLLLRIKCISNKLVI